MKQTKAPKDRSAPIRWQHPFTLHQRLFARNVHAAGGTTFFLARVGKVYFLLHGHVAANIIRPETSLDTLEMESVKSWGRGVDLDRDLFDVLVRYHYG